jgi:hypothetical protein
MNKYDVIIIGGGPAGLALAQCCSRIKNKRVLMVERESDIGGCHRVKRVNYNGELLFTEHAPRIYSSVYRNFQTLLKDMGTSFDKLFVPYDFQPFAEGVETTLAVMTMNELLNLTKHFLYFIFDETHGININMMTYMVQNNYSDESIDFIDRSCRMLDGGDANKLTLNEFLQFVNQKFIYSMYQPNSPNDESLLKLWKTHLQRNGVEIMLNSEVINFEHDSDSIKSCDIRYNKTIINVEADHYVIATPPMSLTNILEKTGIPNAFGDNNMLKKWAIETNYLDYISISFHWDSTLILPKVYGFPSSDWGVGFVVMSDYMKFKESNSATVISVMATILDKKSAKLNKTANECYDKQEVIDEIFRQLNESFSGALEPATVAIMTPNIFYDMKEKKWDSYDTAYVAAINTNPIPFYSTKYDKLYTLGTHNGKSVYKFTSMESAVTNAIALSHEIYPILKYKYPIKVAPNVTKILIYTIITIIMIYIIVKFVRF